MKIHILILAILPISFSIVWIYLKDKYEKEPPLKLIKYFLLGILVSILAVFLELHFSKLNVFFGIVSALYTAFFIAAFIEEGLKYIVRMAEVYPEMKETKVFVKRVGAMETYERMLRTSHLIYNDSVSRFNQYIRMFPTKWLAGILGFRERDYIKT